MNNLPRVVARIVPRSESNPRPLNHESSALTTTPPSHGILTFVDEVDYTSLTSSCPAMNEGNNIVVVVVRIPQSTVCDSLSVLN